MAESSYVWKGVEVAVPGMSIYDFSKHHHECAQIVRLLSLGQTEGQLHELNVLMQSLHDVAMMSTYSGQALLDVAIAWGSMIVLRDSTQKPVEFPDAPMLGGR